MNHPTLDSVRTATQDAAAHKLSTADEALELRDFGAPASLFEPEQDPDAFPPDMPPTDEEWEEMWAEEMERREREAAAQREPVVLSILDACNLALARAGREPIAEPTTAGKIARGNIAVMDSFTRMLG